MQNRLVLYFRKATASVMFLQNVISLGILKYSAGYFNAVYRTVFIWPAHFSFQFRDCQFPPKLFPDYYGFGRDICIQTSFQTSAEPA